MFGHRNYSKYSFNAGPAPEPFSLADTVKVNKLQGSQLSVYFRALKHSPSSEQELVKRNNHFEEFKKVLKAKQMERVLKKKLVESGTKKDTIGEMLKRYGVRQVKERDSKPAMRRAPLKSVKTVDIEVPSGYKSQAIYLPTKKKEREKETFVEIAKPIKKEKPKVQIQDIVEHKQLDEQPKCLIEEQLQVTRDEIHLANSQLEQIKHLLNSRKAMLSPVREEEEMEEKASLVRNLVDKKCSPIQPRTQWTVKSLDADRRGKAKKNKLMSTLNNLNQRLQRIQEKYFNEPKMKYKSISDFIPPKSRTAIETLYKNTDYASNAGSISLQQRLEDEPEAFDDDPTEYMQQLIKRTGKVGKPKRDKPTRSVKNDNSVLILMPPKSDAQTESEQGVNPEFYNDPNKFSRGILKKRSASKEDVDTLLEAPLLQESICKSNYLMKEFKLNSNNKNFDLGQLTVPTYDDYSQTDGLKKNVRFSGNVKKNATGKDPRLHSNIDLALKNSLFYHDDQNLIQ